MRVFAVSDLHITDAADPIYRSFVKFISELRAGDILVIAGDLFDLFVGNKKVFTQQYCEFFAAARAACSRGARLHYIEGNHDFLMSGTFRGISGASIHSTRVNLEVAGKKFFFAHGDVVDPRDYGYRMLRGLFRSPLMRLGVWLAPGSWLFRFGNFLSERSRGKRQREFSGVIRVDAADVRRRFRNFAVERMVEGADFVVLGHTHDPDEMSFIVDGRTGHYFNMGYPRASRKIVMWNEGDEALTRTEVF